MLNGNLIYPAVRSGARLRNVFRFGLLGKF